MDHGQEAMAGVSRVKESQVSDGDFELVARY
jgi:hypothetical protein